MMRRGGQKKKKDYHNTQFLLFITRSKITLTNSNKWRVGKV